MSYLGLVNEKFVGEYTGELGLYDWLYCWLPEFGVFCTEDGEYEEFDGEYIGLVGEYVGLTATEGDVGEYLKLLTPDVALGVYDGDDAVYWGELGLYDGDVGLYDGDVGLYLYE